MNQFLDFLLNLRIEARLPLLLQKRDNLWPERDDFVPDMVFHFHIGIIQQWNQCIQLGRGQFTHTSFLDWIKLQPKFDIPQSQLGNCLREQIFEQRANWGSWPFRKIGIEYKRILFWYLSVCRRYLHCSDIIQQSTDQSKINKTKVEWLKISNGKFKIYSDYPCTVNWLVFGKRLDMDVEVNKNKVELKGEGPYRWI